MICPEIELLDQFRMRVIAGRIAPKVCPICRNRMSKVPLRSLLQRVCIKAGHASESTLSHLSCSRDWICHDVQCMLYLHSCVSISGLILVSVFPVSDSAYLRHSGLFTLMSWALSWPMAFHLVLLFSPPHPTPRLLTFTVMVLSLASLTCTVETTVCSLLHPKAGYILGSFQWTWVWVSLCCPILVFSNYSWQLLITFPIWQVVTFMGESAYADVLP